MKDCVNLIKGCNVDSISKNLNIHSDRIRENRLTADVYTFCNDNLMLFKYVMGERVLIKLFNSLKIGEVLWSISNEDNFCIYNV